LTECDQYSETEEVKKEEKYEGKPASEILSEDNENYRLFFDLLDIDVLDQEFVWQIIRMVKPNEDLLNQLTRINQNDKIDWEKLIGSKLNYRILYSLQLIEHFIPSHRFDSNENLQKSGWCATFIQCGGFSYLFSLLRKVANGFFFFFYVFVLFLLFTFYFFINKKKKRKRIKFMQERMSFISFEDSLSLFENTVI
jgi:hypothetical protein